MPAVLLNLDIDQIQVKLPAMPWGGHMINTWLKIQVKSHLIPWNLLWLIPLYIVFLLFKFPIDLLQCYISHLIFFK